MNTINTALCSYGKSGLVFHGPLLEKHPGFKISKILERKNNISLGRHENAKIVRMYSDILEDDTIELIIVNTPDYLHYDMTMQALLAGKHVIVEKPFTRTVEEAEELIALAKKQKVMLSVFQNRRWDGDFLTIKKIIQEKQLGRLVSFESHFDRYRNFIQDSWKDDKTIGSGTLFNLGSHMLDQTLSLFGMPSHLYADLRALRDNSEVNDSFDIILHYDSVKCMVRGSLLVKEQGPRYILHGTNGSFLKYGLDLQEEMLEAGAIPGSDHWGEDPPELYGLLNSDISGKDIISKIPTLPGNYLKFYDNIYEHIRNGEELEVSAEQARDVIKLIEAAILSSKEQRTVKLL